MTVSEQTIRDALDALEAFLRSGAQKQTLAFTVCNGSVQVKVAPPAERVSLKALKAKGSAPRVGRAR